MAQPYVGELRIFAGNFAPAGWQFCDGSLLPISENEVLFQLIGTTYGGDGQETFAVPDLRGRVPIHMGTSTLGTTYVIGEQGGVEQVGLTPNQIPSHSHPAVATATGQTLSPQGAFFATVTSTQAGANAYAPAATTPTVAMVPASISQAGGNQPHENMQPTLFVNYIISLFGIFPSPT